MVDYRLGPDVAGAIQLGESIRARKAQQARDDLMLQEARRKIAMEQQVGQYLPGALQGDTNALAALFRISPDRGMAVTNWLATQQQRDLQRQVTEARLAKIRGGGVGGGGPVVPAVNPWGAPGPASAPASRPAMSAPSRAPVAVPGATSAVPLRMSGAPSFADTAGADEPPMPTGGSGLDDEEADEPPAMSLSVGPGGKYILTTPNAQPVADEPQGAPAPQPGRRPGGPAAFGLPADIYEARSQGYVALLDAKGKPQMESGYMAMWKPGVAGSAVMLPLKRDVEPKGEVSPFGNSLEARAIGILLRGDPSSPEYEAAYSVVASPRVTPDGQIVRPDMRAYRPPARFAQPTRQPAQAPQTAPVAPLVAGGTSGRAGVGVPVQAPAGPPQAPLGTPTIEEPDKPRLSATDRSKLRQAQVDATTLVRALDDFVEKFRSASMDERLRTVAGQPTALSTAWTNTALLAKGEALFNLGVLNGPDLMIIQRALANPATFMGSMARDEDVQAQADQIRSLIATRINEFERRSGQPLTDFGGSRPTQDKPTGNRPWERFRKGGSGG